MKSGLTTVYRMSVTVHPCAGRSVIDWFTMVKQKKKKMKIRGGLFL